MRVLAFSDLHGARGAAARLVTASAEADLVIGSRKRLSDPGSLTFPQRFGNELATRMMNVIYGMHYTDLGPFRAIAWPALMRIGMVDQNYGWTVEMQIKAAKARLRVREIDVHNRSRIAGRSKVAGTVREPSPDPALAHNTLLVFGPDGESLARYRKIHLFDVDVPGGPNERESDMIRPGPLEPTVVDAPGIGRLGLSVCYDLRFPELYRLGADRGADAFTVIANWPSARAEHWRTLLRARAIENLAYVFAVNRCGRDPYLGYDGRSVVIAPDGEVLEELGDETRVASVEIDATRVSNWRETFPALADRRPILSQEGASLPAHTHDGRPV